MELGHDKELLQEMGFSRETFYRCHRARDEGGIEALLDKNRRKPNLKNRVDEGIETEVKKLAIEFSAFCQVRASNDLRKRGILVSPSGICSIWLHHDLSSLKQRLFALEKKSAEDGIPLTESQLAALEKRRIMTWQMKRLKPFILAMLDLRIPSMSIVLKVLDGFISNHLLISIPRLLLQSSTLSRSPLPLQIYLH